MKNCPRFENEGCRSSKMNGGHAKFEIKGGPVKWDTKSGPF